MTILKDAHSIAAYIPQLRRYARALTGDRNAADDLVQDTLERAWKRFALWRPGSDLRAWLFTIMHNVFVNQVRAVPRNQPPQQVLPEITIAAPQEDRLRLRDLNNALRELSPELREVVLLIGLEQMSYEQAAKVLGIPIGTVMSRLSRAREQLRTIINGTSTASQLKIVK
jgi:RNA polymerase sigma-70 factor (ECF subfamily)